MSAGRGHDYETRYRAQRVFERRMNVELQVEKSVSRNFTQIQKKIDVFQLAKRNLLVNWGGLEPPMG